MSAPAVTGARLRRLAVFACVLQALVLAFFVAGTHGWLTKGGVKPNTTDFASFYAAGRLANAGQPADAYDHALHLAAEEAATSPGIKYQHFFNPPPYLLLNQPFALLPYIPAFILFEGLTLALWLRLGTRVAGGGATAAMCLLAVPSVWWVLGLGQNSFLNAALMAAGTLLLQRRPGLAGAAFGALCYKPHLGLLLPVALLAGRQWRAFAAAAGTVAAMVATTLLLYGLPTWRAFFAMARQANDPIAGGDVLFAAHIDPLGALHFTGLGWIAAQAGAVLVAVVVVVAVAWAWLRNWAPAVRYALLVAGTLMVVPFALFYDLIMASLAGAWLVRDARRTGFLRGEPAVLALCAALNLFTSLPVAARDVVGVPFGALVPPLLFGLALRRGLAASFGRNF